MWTAAGITFGLFVLIAGIWAAGIRYGRNKEKGDVAEDKVDELERDADIASKPYVDKPFGGMRPKK